MESGGQFADLMQRIRAGDQDAVCRLVAEYEPHIRRFVRRKLNQRLRSKFDSLDFVQVVWASVFRAPNRFREIQSPAELIRLLAGMASHKVLAEAQRRLELQKFNVNREISFSNPDGTHSEFPSSEPTPSAVAVAKERWHRLLDGQSEQVRSIVSLRFQGHTYVEIAERLKIHERTARKAIEKLLTSAD